MSLLDFFRRRESEETRAVGAGYTSAMLAAREAYISGASGIAELTGTAQSCVSLWEGGIGLADVEGTDLLTRQCLALAGRSLALRGEAVFLIRDDGLVPVSDWSMRTRNARPTAYQITVPEIGGGVSMTALAAEVLHFRVASDPGAPYYGQSPLRRARLTAGLLQKVESGLQTVYGNAAIGAKTLAIEGIGDEQFNKLKADFGMRDRYGEVLLMALDPSHSHPQAATVTPQDMTPDISKVLLAESLAASREAILMAFGVLPSLANGSTTGPLVREAQRHLAQWTLQPLAVLMAEEASEKLAPEVKLDVMRPLQAFDAGGRARAAAGVVQMLTMAKEAGVDPEMALNLVDWGAE
ncbi:MAG: phage portal protein [Paracoccaceae bacterium]|nr:phage portal protein [Paracoccaceae bacterium]